MKKDSSIKTETFTINTMPGWFIDIVEHKTGDIVFDAWLYHDKIGVKMYVCGDCRVNGTTKKEFIDMMKSYLFFPGEKATGTFFDWYTEEYMQDEILYPVQQNQHLN